MSAFAEVDVVTAGGRKQAYWFILNYFVMITLYLKFCIELIS